MEIVAINMRSFEKGNFIKKKKFNPTKKDVKIPDKEPDIVFLGLILGNSFFPPKNLPPK